jgi:hypothetical protein
MVIVIKAKEWSWYNIQIKVGAIEIDLLEADRLINKWEK